MACENTDRLMKWDKNPPERDSSRDKYLRHDKGGYFQSEGKRWIIQ